jgi:hypothetical protein
MACGSSGGHISFVPDGKTTAAKEELLTSRRRWHSLWSDRWAPLELLRLASSGEVPMRVRLTLGWLTLVVSVVACGGSAGSESTPTDTGCLRACYSPVTCNFAPSTGSEGTFDRFCDGRYQGTVYPGPGCSLEVSINDAADIDRFCGGRFQGTYYPDGTTNDPAPVGS